MIRKVFVNLKGKNGTVSSAIAQFFFFFSSIEINTYMRVNKGMMLSVTWALA